MLKCGDLSISLPRDVNMLRAVSWLPIAPVAMGKKHETMWPAVKDGRWMNEFPQTKTWFSTYHLSLLMVYSGKLKETDEPYETEFYLSISTFCILSGFLRTSFCCGLIFVSWALTNERLSVPSAGNGKQWNRKTLCHFNSKGVLIVWFLDT